MKNKPIYLFAKTINKTKLSGIVDVGNLPPEVICYCSEEKSVLLINALSVKSVLIERDEKIKLLEKYSEFLEKHGYLDTDWKTEPPYAIDEFLNNEL